MWEPDSKEKFRAALNLAEVRELVLDFASHTFKETDCFKTKFKTSENEAKKETNKCVKQKWFDN